MHHKNNFYIWLGVLVAIVPFLGVPSLWKVYLTTFSGILLVLQASWPMILKRLQSKPKIKKKINKVGNELRFENRVDNIISQEQEVNADLMQKIDKVAESSGEQMQ